ncbi:MAG: hypothetical protein JSW61_12485 [Candidatus Thorarchaeota archaeon]|nr:MAG: hypothetical protein JSW61_12485 [Candidatus Thorarchaeota archaeon]
MRLRKLGSVFLIAALFAPYLFALGIAPMPVAAQNQTIVFDMTHGQYSSYIFPNEDTDLKADLEALGYTVVWAWGGLNDTILADADGLMIGGIYGATAGFAQAEIDDVAEWFNAGNKFMWVGSDSDYAGYAYINNNASAILSAVGSHVYPEPISVSDSESNCNASYRAVANVTSSDPFVADILANVDQILMHGPTCLYGSTTGDGAGAVDLRDTTIANVYPVLFYSPAATIGDSDLVAPLAHSDGDVGSFVAMTVETYAGEAGTGVLMVAGASQYGDYKPMYADEYYDVTLSGQNLVPQAIEFGMDLAPTLTAGLDLVLILGAAGAVVVVIVIVAVFMRRR